jgi:NAD(P)-dependent dehydrogenase (short-subunit alcohol dehydrogenase family)
MSRRGRPCGHGGGAEIVNIGSGTAFKGLPGLAHYVASKGAIIMLTRTLANELGGDNVLVNVVSPGFTLTEAVRGNSSILEHSDRRPSPPEPSS